MDVPEHEVYCTYSQMSIPKREHVINPWIKECLFFRQPPTKPDVVCWWVHHRDRCAYGMRFAHRYWRSFSHNRLALVRFAQLEPWARPVLARANMARTSRSGPAAWHHLASRVPVASMKSGDCHVFSTGFELGRGKGKPSFRREDWRWSCQGLKDHLEELEDWTLVDNWEREWSTTSLSTLEFVTRFQSREIEGEREKENDSFRIFPAGRLWWQKTWAYWVQLQFWHGTSSAQIIQTWTLPGGRQIRLCRRWNRPRRCLVCTAQAVASLAPQSIADHLGPIWANGWQFWVSNATIWVAKRLLGDSGRSGQVSPKESLKERLMNKQREGGADDAKKAPGPELAPRQTTLVLLPMLDLSYFFLGGTFCTCNLSLDL